MDGKPFIKVPSSKDICCSIIAYSTTYQIHTSWGAAVCSDLDLFRFAGGKIQPRQ